MTKPTLVSLSLALASSCGPVAGPGFTCRAASFTIVDSMHATRYDWSAKTGLVVRVKGRPDEALAGFDTCGEAAAEACGRVDEAHGEHVPGCWPY